MTFSGPALSVLFSRRLPDTFLYRLSSGIISHTHHFLAEGQKTNKPETKDDYLLFFLFTLLERKSGDLPESSTGFIGLHSIQQLRCIPLIKSEAGRVKRHDGDRRLYFLQSGICIMCFPGWSDSR